MHCFHCGPGLVWFGVTSAFEELIRANHAAREMEEARQAHGGDAASVASASSVEHGAQASSSDEEDEMPPLEDAALQGDGEVEQPSEAIELADDSIPVPLSSHVTSSLDELD